METVEVSAIDSVVYFDGDEIVPCEVAEEVVIDPSGGEGESVDNYQRQQNSSVDGDIGSIVEVENEGIDYDDGSERMSVAIDLAKLSQGHFADRDNHLRKGKHKFKPEGSLNGYVFYTENGTQAQSLSDIEGRTVHVEDVYAKPRMSYAQLIAEALINSEEGVLTLSEIYQAISARHPFYKMEARNWQNSIRHNLTLNKNFCKLPRLTTEGRGSHWRLEKGAERTIFKRGGRSNPPKVKESFSMIMQDPSSVVVGEEVVETTVVDTSNPDETILIMTIPQS